MDCEAFVYVDRHLYCIICCFVLAVAPEITYDDALKAPIVLKSGNILLISVNIAGVPTPRVRWSRDDAELTVTAATNIETRDTYSTLTIKGVTGDNTGRYKVTASNVVDEVSAEFTVRIKGWCYFGY